MKTLLQHCYNNLAFINVKKMHYFNEAIECCSLLWWKALNTVDYINLCLFVFLVNHILLCKLTTTVSPKI